MPIRLERIENEKISIFPRSPWLVEKETGKGYLIKIDAPLGSRFPIYLESVDDYSPRLVSLDDLENKFERAKVK